jgi:protein-L-isoaspartate(D-aspartate) O-methyltransferase
MASDYAAARLNMVESQVRTNDVTDVRLHDAMRRIPREDFAPPGKAYLAYADSEIEYAPGRWLLRPRDVAKLLHALKPQPGERALAIAAPYAAAALEALDLSVTRVDGESLEPPAGSQFDIVICEGAVSRAPESWVAALGLNGRLGVVEREGPVGRAMVYVLASDGVGKRPVFDSTPPVLAGFERERGFSF